MESGDSAGAAASPFDLLVCEATPLPTRAQQPAPQRAACNP